jgi:4-amino-4-deoxy-L-arabinose transferase-like glycosyltransferase
LAAALSPLVSPFRVVLSPGTLGLGLLVLAAPRVVALGRSVPRSRFEPVVARLKTVPWFGMLAVLGLGAYALFLALHVGAYAGQTDSSGYLNNARLLGEARVATPMRIVAGIPPTDLPANACVPLGFRPHGDRDMAPIYPIGLPLAVLAVAWLAGWEVAPHLVMVCHALFGVILMYGLTREAALSRGWAVLGAVLLATSPLYLFISLQLMSDMPAMVWTTGAVWLAWRSRRDARWTAAAGAALAFAVLVRPTNLLALAPVAVVLGASFQRWAWLIAGGAPGAGLLLFYNLAAYGHPLETGYGDMGRLFSLGNLSSSFSNYLNNLPVVLTPLVALAGGLPILWRRSPRLVTMLVLWISSFGVLYAFYYHTHETWWYLRFVLPAFPPLIVGALLVARRLLDLWPRRWWVDRAGVRAASCAAGVAMAALIIAHNIRWDDQLQVAASGYDERVYPEATGWARTHLPPDAVVAAKQLSGALFYYTHFPLLRWDSFRGDSFAPVEARLKARGQPLYAVLFPYETEQFRALTDHLPGRWTKVGFVRQVTVWRLEGPESEPPH